MSTTNEEVPRLRPISAELNILTRSDGSALVTHGGSSVVCSVNGPIEVLMQNLDTNKAYLDVSYRPKSGLPGVNEKYKEKIIRNVCETALLTTIYPRTAIAVQVQEMDDNGGILACAINTVNLALIKSGLEMKFLVAAVYCALDVDGKLHLDPQIKDQKILNKNYKFESNKFKATFTFAFDSIQEKVISVHTDGKFSVTNYNDAAELCRAASKHIFEFYKQMIQKSSTVL